MKVLLLILVVVSLVVLIGLIWQSRQLLKKVVNENNTRPKQPRERQIHPKLKQQQKPKDDN